jgi:hypothetical protein
MYARKPVYTTTDVDVRVRTAVAAKKNIDFPSSTWVKPYIQKAAIAAKMGVRINT